MANPALQTMQALHVPFFDTWGAPHDYREAFGPRLGIAYAMGAERAPVFRAGSGLYYNDLAQNGWVTALTVVNQSPGICVNPGDSYCQPGAANGGSGSLIDRAYKPPTPRTPQLA